MVSTAKMALVVGIVMGFSVACTTPKPRPRSAPKTTPKETSAVSDKTLTPEQMEEIQTLVRQGMTSINRCYQKELEDAPKPFKARIIVEILVGTATHVKQIRFSESSLKSERFERCISETIKGWEFPRLKTEASFTYPFTFEPAY
ncbi:MAG: AgmX/PglI C-terminal domain-containing protein [Deltaproteobacteria bacterium]|nr:AgmX/PglI C-terminal domain-containing protein [Deltaproteobacteria bacterium]